MSMPPLFEVVGSYQGIVLGHDSDPALVQYLHQCLIGTHQAPDLFPPKDYLVALYISVCHHEVDHVLGDSPLAHALLDVSGLVHWLPPSSKVCPYESRCQ